VIEGWRWKAWIGIGLIALSAALYVAEYLIFRSARDTLFYLMQDIAFLPISALLVAGVLTEVMAWRDRSTRLEKLNMVIGAFFSEAGGSLLRRLLAFDSSLDGLRAALRYERDWTEADFAAARKALAAHVFRVDVRRGDLPALTDELVAQRPFVLGLLQNPFLFEHESFSELLWAVLHLTEELSVRTRYAYWPEEDLDHLSGDIERAERLILKEWVAYLAHLSRAFSSRRLSAAAREGFVGTRGAGRSPSFAAFSRRRRRQVCLFWYWLRCARQVTTMPVGRWRRRTALSVTFWCWPPGPPARNVSTSHSASRASSEAGSSTAERSAPVSPASGSLWRRSSPCSSAPAVMARAATRGGRGRCGRRSPTRGATRRPGSCGRRRTGA
jgi:hypothetical protein